MSILPKFRSEWKQLRKAGFTEIVESNSLDYLLEQIKRNLGPDAVRSGDYYSDHYLTKGKFVGSNEKYVLFFRKTDDR